MIEHVLDPHRKDLGGFEVRRTLPQAARRTINPFVFFDHEVEVDSRSFAAGKLLVFAPGDTVAVEAVRPSTVLLFGGEPGGPRFVKRNFVSSSRERIAQAKADWRGGRMKLPEADHDEWIALPDDPPPAAHPMS